jgi:hypothetical protein
MDGRVQLPVIHYLQKRYDVEFVDVVTEPGANRMLATREPKSLRRSILERVDISVVKHNSKAIAVVGHADCAGNPADKTEQWAQIREGVQTILDLYPTVECIGLWLDTDWVVQEVPCT